MSVREASVSVPARRAAGEGGLLDRLARRAVLARLAALTTGAVAVEEGGRRTVLGGGDAPPVSLRVHRPAFWSRVALGGSIGAGEAYRDGLWSSDDLVGLIRLLAADRAATARLESGTARMAVPLARLVHRLRANTRSGSRRNIADHYDLGNGFFETVLDPTLTYSCAVFPRQDASLEEASVHKLDGLCRLLDLRPEDELLEIGTGWGSLALHAASRYGCRVVTTTISRRQHAHARERIAAAGLADRITVLGEDYRDLPDRLGRRFRKIVSVEMVEAVGAERLGRYLATCRRLLADDGHLLLQSIVIADHLWEAYRASTDFIQKHVFPGGCLPSVAALTASMARATDLRLVRLEEIGPHYATTLAAWRANLLAGAERIRDLGHDDSLIRLFDFYFAYCEAGFRERVLGDVQLLMAAPRAEVRP